MNTSFSCARGINTSLKGGYQHEKFVHGGKKIQIWGANSKGLLPSFKSKLLRMLRRGFKSLGEKWFREAA